jgi:hypothetical protein
LTETVDEAEVPEAGDDHAERHRRQQMRDAPDDRIDGGQIGAELRRMRLHGLGMPPPCPVVGGRGDGAGPEEIAV